MKMIDTNDLISNLKSRFRCIMELLMLWIMQMRLISQLLLSPVSIPSYYTLHSINFVFKHFLGFKHIYRKSTNHYVSGPKNSNWQDQVSISVVVTTYRTSLKPMIPRIYHALFLKRVKYWVLILLLTLITRKFWSHLLTVLLSALPLLYFPYLIWLLLLIRLEISFLISVIDFFIVQVNLQSENISNF